ncbi:MAG: DegT/DnrJ/EryC1/StrS family aminotransferase [Solirubrobacteraceae bacterium]|nr:DegT/DnrJ/EryC1/StrS family aminotransferase [Solirubrobacteraceae bacterium]
MIPLTRPLVDFADVVEDFRRIVESGTLTSGAYVAGFEADLADYVGVAHAIATTSATTALHLVLAAAGIGPGDEVLVSDFTFPASGNVIAQCGARPVLVDCAPGGFLLDLEDAAARITPRTRALMAIDPFGQPCDLAGAATLARDHGLLLVEDAACALGAHVDGRRCGAWPGAAAFSFHPRKIITTGEGGMVTTDDDDLAARLRLLRNHGGMRGDVGMRFDEHGFNYRMSELQAAMGRAQMRRLDEMLAGRRTAAAAYDRALAAADGVTVPAAGSAGATFQSYVLLLADGIDRDAVSLAMRAAGIETTIGTYAMHAQPAFAAYGHRPGDLPHSHRAQEGSLTLPLWPGMGAAVVEEVVAALSSAVEEQW